MGSLRDHDYKLRIVMLPWLAHGHISPSLELSKALSRHNILLHLCSTPVNLASIRHQLDPAAFPSVRLVELHLPAACGLPPHHHSTNNLPSHLMPRLKRAFDLAEPAFARLLDALRPDLVIYDFLQPWAPSAARRRGIPAVQFLTTTAASMAAGHFMRSLMRPPEAFPFPAMRDVMREDLERTPVGSGEDRERFLQCMESSCGFIALRSFREIESEYIDYYSSLIGKEIVPVGALVPDDISGGGGGGDSNEGEKSIMEWLSTKESDSVVFVSFGSEYLMSEEEVEEMAQGLELSGASFVWVVRLQTPAALPEEFRERVRGRGLVVEGWAPQRSILAHRAVGGFVTHCGWSSVVEAMSLGVPMLFLPMQLDQPINAKLAMEKGVGIEIKRRRREKGGGMRINGEEVGEGVRELVMGEGGERARRKAGEMAAIMREKRRGEEVEVFVGKIAQLCEDSKKINNGGGREELK